MDAYIIEFLNPDTAEIVTETVARQSFAEVASWAYIRRLHFGSDWKIDSIRRYGIVNV